MCLEKFDEIPSMIIQDIKETKLYGHTDGRSFGRTDNVKTVYPPTNLVCRGYNHINCSPVAMVLHTNGNGPYKSNRKAMNRNWSNQKANPALKTKTGNK